MLLRVKMQSGLLIVWLARLLQQHAEGGLLHIGIRVMPHALLIRHKCGRCLVWSMNPQRRCRLCSQQLALLRPQPGKLARMFLCVISVYSLF
jgi:hypothetical protein